jgi:hypothetical protein
MLAVAAVAMVAAMVRRGRSDADDGGKHQSGDEELTHVTCSLLMKELLRLAF